MRISLALLLLLLIALFSGCKKDSNASPCAREMRSLFQDELECKTGGAYNSYANLAKGEYKGATVYFISASICMNCLVAFPTHGYTCEKEKIEFDDFRDVKNIKQVFDSCSKQYLD